MPSNILLISSSSRYSEGLLDELRAFSLPDMVKISLKANEKKRAIIISPENNLEDSLEVNSQLFVRLDILADLFSIGVG